MPKLTHDYRVFLYALLGGAPALAVSFAYLWTSDVTLGSRIALSSLLLIIWLSFAAATRMCVVRPLQTTANLLSALREEDFSFRARGANHFEPLGDVLAEINLLSSFLQDQRLGALEATALLRTVMEEIEVAIFAFDQEKVLRLVNRAGQQLLGHPSERLLGRTAEDVGLADCLIGESRRLLASNHFPSGRWGLRRTFFREGGQPHHLVVIADLSQPLREEELRAWQRLVRVLSHELNNSLAPIKSIAGTLSASLSRDPRPADWEEDMRTGLNIIETRADGLSRFTQAYAQLARLPRPALTSVDLPELVRRVCVFEIRLPITVLASPPLHVLCDSAQIEQVLINLVKNAVDAALEQRATGKREAGVRVAWKSDSDATEIIIEDDGPGLAQTANLFVPFFTTKAEGSGIGLVLCRQITENHGGSLELKNRQSAAGCIATLRLPTPTPENP